MDYRFPFIIISILLFPLVSGFGCTRDEQKNVQAAEVDQKTTGSVVEPSPAIVAEDQALPNGSVTIASVTTLKPSWIVIHNDKRGKPNDVIGYALVAEGTQQFLSVEIDKEKATEKLYAMLHSDEGEVRMFDPASDTPLQIDGNLVMTSFIIHLP